MVLFSECETDSPAFVRATITTEYTEMMRLKGCDLIVFAFMFDSPVWHDHVTGICGRPFFTHQELSRVTGYSRVSVMKSLRRLEERDLVKVEKVYGDRPRMVCGLTFEMLI